MSEPMHEQWKTFQKKIDHNIKTRGLAVSFIHWRMESKGLQCIGFGEEFRGDLDKPIEEEEVFKKIKEGNEVIKYKDETGKTYLLKCESVDGDKYQMKATLTRKNDDISCKVNLDLMVMMKNNQLSGVHVWSHNVDKLFDKMGKMGEKRKPEDEKEAGVNSSPWK